MDRLENTGKRWPELSEGSIVPVIGRLHLRIRHDSGAAGLPEGIHDRHRMPFLREIRGKPERLPAG
jgi:hypothetical protein